MLNWRGQLHAWGALTRLGEARRHFREIERTDPRELGRRDLETLLHRACAQVPYYGSLGVDPQRIESFPILSRAALRENVERLKNRTLDPRKILPASTGGSTGEPVRVVQDETFRQWTAATDMVYFERFLGLPYRTYLSHPRVSLWHRRRPAVGRRGIREILAALLGQIAFLEPYTAFSEEVLLRYVETINRMRPLVVWAFASSLYELARFVRRKNLRIHSPGFILSSVEMLYPAMRETIQATFGCPVYDSYGAVEAGRIAGECTHGRLHVFSFANFVEVLDPANRPVSPGQEGRIVVTTLHNDAMPLIRYDIGDMAEVAPDPCPCGNPLPSWHRLTGRVVEHFVTADGLPVYGGRFIAMFYAHEWVASFQVLQEDVDRVTVFYTTVPGCPIPPGATEQLSAYVREALGSAWREVDEIPRTPLGKHLHTRSLVWEDRQARDAYAAERRLDRGAQKVRSFHR